ncbi:MAG: dienelactone hydrolase family protein [Chloroflexi bacterium]|nr:dienelactone hydrolase family protein [Chloroflexota bacterium]
MNRGDATGAGAVFADTAEASMPWLVRPGVPCCRGQAEIRSAIQASVRENARFAVTAIAPSGSGSEVKASVEVRSNLTSDFRFVRAILAVTARFSGNKIVLLDQQFDLADPVTARVARYKPLVEAVNAPPTPTPTPGGKPFVPAWRPIATPPNGDLPNTEWIELDAPGNFKLLAAVQRPVGPGPFPVVVLLHGGGGLNKSVVRNFQSGGYVAAGFMTVIGCWFDGDNPLNPPAPDLIRCPNGPPYEISYINKVRYADALVQTARILPGADARHVGVYGSSQGAGEAVLLASTGTQVQAVVSDSGPYAQGFARGDTPPIQVVQNLSAPLLILHGAAAGSTEDSRAVVQDAYDYEAALKALKKPYEAVYYPGVAHDPGPSGDPSSRDDARARTIAFFKKYLITP